ncbi:MAG: T9SS type A sorting domain-containing protein [Saprospiraceae bacterium]|nr:T9SS type A sorting domain-containing protein [Saprospiraceae bacterium]
MLKPITGDVVYASCFGKCFDNAQCISGTIDGEISNDLFELIGNPSMNGSVVLNFSKESNHNKIITLINGTGGQLTSTKISGVSSFQMDTYQLNAGIYYIMVKSDDKVQTRKFVKL